GDAEQHSREDQEQGGCIMPGEQQQCHKQRNNDAADRYRPCQIAAGSKAIVGRNSHGDSFSRRFGSTLSSNAGGIKPAKAPAPADAERGDQSPLDSTPESRARVRFCAPASGMALIVSAEASSIVA